MKKFLFLFTMAGLVLMSCEKEEDQMDDEYKVNITIDNPLADAVVTLNEAMPVKVSFSRGAEEVLHHVKIMVMDADNNVVETLLEDHVHTQGSYDYDEAAAFTPTMTGTFKIKAVSHDMADNHSDPVEVTFTVE